MQYPKFTHVANLCLLHFRATRCLHMESCLNNKVSSNNWLKRQRKDVYVKQAAQENYRCRSAFKLLQIQEKYNILKAGQTVIDCGAAPGSWCQVVAEHVNSTGHDLSGQMGLVIGIDLQNISPIPGVYLLTACDFTTEATQEKINEILQGRQADVILSDMAPAATGVQSHNHHVIIGLCFSVLNFSLRTLRPTGSLLCKIWMGSDQAKLEKAMKLVFENVSLVKPDASRDDSAEIFILGRGFKPVGKNIQ